MTLLTERRTSSLSTASRKRFLSTLQRTLGALPGGGEGGKHVVASGLQQIWEAGMTRRRGAWAVRRESQGAGHKVMSR